MTKKRANGEGNIRKRKDGRWEGRIVVGHKENGDSIFRYIYADNQKELTAKLRQNIDAYQGVDLTEESRMTLSEWLDRWLEQMALTLRPGTLKRYRGDMGRHVKPRLGQKKLTQLTAEDLWDLYRELQDRGRIAPRSGQSLGLSPTTVHGGPWTDRPPPRSKPRPLSHHCPRHPRRPPPGPPSSGRPGADAQQPCQTRGTS